MTFFFVLATFIGFILIDYLINRKKALSDDAVGVGKEGRGAAQDYLEGFLVPGDLRYHPGHGWVHRERLHVVKVGMDEFSAALAGRIDRLELPKPGHWIRQGQKAWSLCRGEERSDMVSPIEGEIVEINNAVVNDPSLARKDPYGKGWLMTVFVPDEESTFRNLLPPSLVRAWMRRVVEQLYALQPRMAGAVAADGGRPAEDLFTALGPGKSWTQVTRSFFLT